MFDNIQAYAGNVIGDGPSSQAGIDSAFEHSNPQTPDEIIECANREAEELLEMARHTAVMERDAILNDAQAQADLKIAENITQAAMDLRMELWSAKAAMGRILSDALDTIVGDIGHDRMVLGAIEKATADYSKTHSMIVYGNNKTLQRLRLVAIGSSHNLKELGFTFQLDAGLTDGRCVLSHADSRVEIGLDAQVEALKKVFNADAVNSLKVAQSQVSTTGKLA